MFLHSLASLVIFAQSSETFSAAVENVFYLGVLVVIYMKNFCVLLIGRKLILEILETLEENFPHNSLDQRAFGVRKYFKRTKFLNIFGFFLYNGTSLLFLLIPIFYLIRDFFTSSEIEPKFIYVLWFPSFASKSILFWPLYLIQFWFSLISAILIFYTDILYANLLTVTAMEFDILAQQISELEGENASRKLKKLIEVHQKLIEDTKKLETVFSPLLLVDILGFIGIACCTMFLSLVKKKIKFFI
jgi:hypothetical protein